MTQDSGDAGNTEPKPLTPLEASLAPGSVPFQIDLLQALVVDPHPEWSLQEESRLKLRGLEVKVLRSFDIDSLVHEDPIDLLLIRIDRQTDEAIPFVRSSRRIYQKRGIVVLGLAEKPPDDAQILTWLETGIDDFLFASHPQAFDQRIQIAEHRVKRNRARHETARDINQSLRRFETLFVNSGDAELIVAPSDGRIQEASVVCKQVLGWRREEIAGRFLSLVFPDLYRRDDLLKAGEAARRNGGTQMVKSIAHRKPDGARCLLDARVSAVPWGDSESLSIAFFDVTLERAKQERRLRAAKLDTVSCFSSGVADDLSNVFTAVNGNLSLIDQHPTLSAGARELLSNAESACKTADKIIATLRLLSKSNTAQNSINESIVRKRPINVAAFLERVVSFELLGSNVRLSSELSENLHPVHADENTMEIAVREIVNNALDAMPSGGSLRILATNYEAAASGVEGATPYVLVSIVDDGPGISPENRGHVFDPYFSTRPGHAGLGLATSQALVRAHGGIVDVEAAPVRGTVVRIYLPAVVPSQVDSPHDDLERSALSGEGTDSGRRQRVLVMDDDKDIRIITKKILNGSGFDVYCTKDGREAIDVYQKAHQMGAPFDVALFDLDVRGGMGGKDAVAKLRRDFPSIRVILMTGYVDDILLENHQEHGFSGVITKPFQIDKLVATISQFAGARHTE